MSPLLPLLFLHWACAPAEKAWFDAPVRVDLEKLEGGIPFTPNTQSFGRGAHHLDSGTRISATRRGDSARLVLGLGGGETFTWENLPVHSLAPRLFYEPGSAPDAFDAFNLRMAEYSRNGVTVPHGGSADSMAHFESPLSDTVPWRVDGPYALDPNPRVRPVRAAVVNNCLQPGLWELAATDRAGELYHGWFSIPDEAYFSWVAEVNGLPEPFVREALAWSLDAVPADLSRLRTPETEHGEVAARLAPDGDAGFSSQSSRRKLQRGFARVPAADRWRAPVRRSELTATPVRMVEFVPPGVYDPEATKTFDLRFLAGIEHARVREVRPLTGYSGRSSSQGALELELELGTHRIVLGNLPVDRLVPQEDLVIPGFGVGVLEASTPAERRALKWEEGPAPSFAYLLEGAEGAPRAINTHDVGIEQVFIRTFPNREPAVWEVTVTSFERIVDLVRYEVEIPPALVPDLRRRAENYITPVYLAYRDDNLR